MTDPSSQSGGTVDDKTEPLKAEQVADLFAQEVDDLITERWDFHIAGQDWRVAYAEEMGAAEAEDLSPLDDPLVLMGPGGLMYEIELLVTAKPYGVPAGESA